MTPFEWAMIIMSAIGTAGAATSGTDVDQETPALPGGASPADIKPIFGTGGAGGVANFAQPTSFPTLEGPAKATAAAAAATPKTQFTSTPKIPIPGEKEEPEAKDIWQILAAIQPAITAAAPLLGLGDRPVPQQRPAPVAGGQPGQPVGQFAQPFGRQPDIAQLLAALPGIRG